MTETPTRTLADFLLARIAEDEEVAQWLADYACEGCGSTELHGCPGLMGGARNYRDPRRALAECEAKRRIIEWHKSWPVLVETPPTFEQSDGEGFDYARGDMSSLTMRVSKRIAWLTEQEYRNRFGSEPPTGPVLKLLALPYADHPEFQEAWRV